MKVTVNQLANFIANNAPSTIRQQWLGAGTGNTKQTQAWFDFGWPETVDFNVFYKMFKRSPLATCVVNTPPNVCWTTAPNVYEGESADLSGRKSKTKFERDFTELADRLSLFKKLKEADVKARVGYYSALIIQVSGAGDQIAWDKPLGRINAMQVQKLRPAYCEQLKPSTWDDNPQSIRYGHPVTYSYNEASVGDNNESVKRTMTIHHSRVIVFTEQPESDSIYGIACLESLVNDILMLELIGGSGGQGFFMNSGNKMHFDVRDDAQGPLDDDEKEKIKTGIEDFTSKLQDFLVTSGMDATKLQAVLENPEPFKTMYQENISAASGIPKNRLIGSQTGVLAGDKDDASFLSSMNSRNTNWCAQMVNQVIDWFIAHGCLPNARYFVEFDDLLSASDEQRFSLVDKMTAANDKHITAQVKLGTDEISPLFTDEEIRLVAGYKEPVKVKVMQEEDIIDEPVDEQLDDAN